MADDLRVQILAIPQNNPSHPIEEHIILPDTGREGKIDTAQERDLLETALNRLRQLYPQGYEFRVNGHRMSTLANTQAIIGAYNRIPIRPQVYWEALAGMRTGNGLLLHSSMGLGIAHGHLRLGIEGVVGVTSFPGAPANITLRPGQNYQGPVDSARHVGGGFRVGGLFCKYTRKSYTQILC